MRKYSLLVHVTHTAQRDSLEELLESLANQTYKNFEVIIVEECGGDACGILSSLYKNQLVIRYYNKKEAGEGYTRNFAFEKASGDYFILFDTSSVLPADYLEKVDHFLQTNYLDSFLAPVIAYESMSTKQKAMFYSFKQYSVDFRYDKNKKDTLPFYSGNINMGFSREVFNKTKGYIISEFGEEMEFWIRIQKSGFKEGVIKDAFIFHKGIKDYKEFFKDMSLLGRARINVYRFFKEELKPTHFVPVFFFLFLIATAFSFFIYTRLFIVLLSIVAIYSLLIFFDSLSKNKKVNIAFLSLPALYVQWIGYSLGFISELYKELSGTKKKV